MTTDLPELLHASDVETWSDEVDVVVVGFGIAGACAALEAARAGASVILLERAAEYGGTSAMAGGHFYLGGGTAVQKATGIEDSAEEMFKYLMAVSLDPDEDKVRAFCEDSVEHFDWIESLGMEFERSLYEKKAVIQPGTQGLMFTGNEKVHPFRDIAKPAPRGHKVPKPGDTGGAKIVLDALAERLAETDADVRYETGATNLVVEVGPEGGGAVVGLAWRKYDERGVIRARSVVIAAGGYVGNDKMIAEYTPQLGSKLFPLASTYDDGLGIRLGASAGAELRCMEQAFITAPFYPPAQLVTGIVVNKEGQSLRRRGLLPLAHVGLRDGPDRPGGVPHRRLGPHRAPRLPAVPVHRRLGDGVERWSRLWASRPVRWRRRSRRTTRTRSARRTPTSTSTPTGWSRRTPARGAPTTSRSARRCTPASPWAACASPSTARSSARTAR